MKPPNLLGESNKLKFVGLPKVARADLSKFFSISIHKNADQEGGNQSSKTSVLPERMYSVDLLELYDVRTDTPPPSKVPRIPQPNLLIFSKTDAIISDFYEEAKAVPSIRVFPPSLVAHELTLIESAIFRDIPSTELLNYKQKNPHTTIVRSFDFFNYISTIIWHSLLTPEEPTECMLIIRHWIEIAEFCLEHHNYQTLQAIVLALKSNRVYVKRIWEGFRPTWIKRLQTMYELVSHEKNYKCLRDVLNDLSPGQSVIPCLGMFFLDLAYAREKINVRSSEHIEVIRSTLERHQKTPPYPDRPPEEFFKNAKSFNDRSSFSVPDNLQRINVYILTRLWVTEKKLDHMSSLQKERLNSSPSPTIRTRSLDSITSQLSMPFSGRGSRSSVGSSVTDSEPATSPGEKRRSFNFTK